MIRLRDGVASTKRKLADYSNCTLHGWLSSASSAKVRAMLAYKRIPFTDLEPSLEQLKASVAPNVGRVCMPAVKLEQAAEQQCGKDTAAKSPFARREKRSHSEWWRQESAVICDDLEAAHPEHPTTPPGVCQRLAASLLELHGDAWLPMLGLHYRWGRPENVIWAEAELRRCAFPDQTSAPGGAAAPPKAQRRSSPFSGQSLPRLPGQPLFDRASGDDWASGDTPSGCEGNCESYSPPTPAQRAVGDDPPEMQSPEMGLSERLVLRELGLGLGLGLREQGVTPSTQPGLVAFAASLVSELDVHLAAHDFLLGGAPCRGDFALYGQLYAVLYRDPHSRHLFSGAPHVVRWFHRLHGHLTDPAFPSDVARTIRLAEPPTGKFLPSDEVPATLDPILRRLFAEQWAYLTAASQSVDAHVMASATASRANASERALPLPRALDYTPFEVGGAQGERLVETHHAWRLQRPLFEYAALASAPSRSLELRAVDQWLERLGVLGAFCAVNPKVRLHRASSLPQAEDVFTPELAPEGIVFRF